MIPDTVGANRYVRRRYLTGEAATRIANGIANATTAARSAELWGVGSTAVASDSTHVWAFEQNFFTEWHFRYQHPWVADLSAT